MTERLCQCGCGKSLESGRNPNAKYRVRCKEKLDGASATRALHRKRGKPKKEKRLGSMLMRYYNAD